MEPKYLKLSIINYQLSIINYQLSIINGTQISLPGNCGTWQEPHHRRIIVNVKL
jgi:hypothetical protein